jgi:hypothetical protein
MLSEIKQELYCYSPLSIYFHDTIDNNKVDIIAAGLKTLHTDSADMTSYLLIVSIASIA